MSPSTTTPVAATAKRLAEAGTRTRASIQLGRIAAACCASLLAVTDRPVKPKSMAEQAGLVGPVHTVRTETAYFSYRAGQWVEGPRNLSSVARYDMRGNQIEELRYRPGGALTEKLTFTYNARGNLAKIIAESSDGSTSTTSHSYDARGNLLSTAFPTGGRVAYSYDGQGNQVEEAHYAGDGSLLNRSVYGYDQAGNRIEATHYGSQSSRGYVSRTVLTYDAAGRLVEETSYGNGGVLTGRTVTGYDAHGNKTEWSLFDHARRLKAKHSYRHEYDPRGNWIVQRSAVLEAVTENRSEKPTAVISRTITYR